MLDDKVLEVVTTDKANEDSKNEATYLYCVAENGVETSLGKIGLDGEEVYTIPFMELCAVVHSCSPKLYQSEDNEVIKRWVVTHEKVVEIAWERFGTILPIGFDTIIKGEKDKSPEENIKSWLEKDYANLKEKINKIRGKAEYGIQIFWEPKFVAEKIAKTNPEIRRMDQDIKLKPKGMAYMLKHKLENFLKKEMEKKASLCFEDFHARIKNCVDEIRVEKTKKISAGSIGDEKQQMIMNLSCLVDEKKSKQLGEELEKINMEEGFNVRFTGPWPPYSFVALG